MGFTARDFIADVCALAGAGLVLLGVGWVYPPLSLICAGLLLLAVGLRLYRVF